MQTIILTLHVLIALALVVVVLLQRSEGGALGIGGSNNMGGLFTARSTANILTRVTAILATAFITTSLLLAIISGRTASDQSIFDQPTISTPVESPLPDLPTTPLSQ
ncbi:MAG: preprotein translocase subunit SecG [Pseudomonadota bacterium]